MSDRRLIPIIRFELWRDEDASGVSGTGKVAAGAMFPSGRCVLEWLMPPYTMGWYEKIEDVEAIHGHDGKTQVVSHDTRL